MLGNIGCKPAHTSTREVEISGIIAWSMPRAGAGRSGTICGEAVPEITADLVNRGSHMTSATWHDARIWRMRAAEIRALADEMKEAEPKAIMLSIAADYDRLAQWTEKS
jgi:hypothetical protein